MADRLVSVDDNFDFPTSVVERQAERLADASTPEGAAAKKAAGVDDALIRSAAAESTLLATSDRASSLARSQIAYSDNAGWTEEWANVSSWDAQAAVTGNSLHNGPTGVMAQRRLEGLESSNTRIVGSIKVTSPHSSNAFVTLIGLSRNQGPVTGMVDKGFFGIGINSANQIMTYPGGAVVGPALTPGTYGVSVQTTASEIICTIYSDNGATYHRYSYSRSEWGQSYQVGVYNSDPRAASGHLVGPIAARIGYASAKPRGTVESRTRWTRYAVNGDDVLIATPASYDSRKPQPWVIYAHGYGDVEETVTTQATAMRPVLESLLTAGYAVAAPNFGGSANWGNPQALASLKNIYRHLRDSYNVGPVVLIGHSMGGLVTLTGAAEGTVPGLAGWVGVEPVVSLSSMYSHPSITEYRQTISNAYGINAGGSNYGTQTGGFDPALRAASDFAGIPMLVFASPSDTAVYKAKNADVLAEKMKSGDFTLVQTSGGHVDPSHFQPAKVLAFVDRVTKG